ncbi:hypothetical protein PBCVCVR1_569R [Paramecium bursaria Chlorella virus CVR-1]|uniref:Uncharacterized protein n=1 Tax=Paramecium bursaria Chlorella virus CVA-1 TaxID=42683 RepID=M1HK53_9PHYC|nr:hypothetical protein F8205_gp281 [Paramecium bursaria Chlorella virus CVA-1]AGE50544.1 hypothetical protein PBCVCVA1_556R [Paramecium bursaria Chlorella virus CVA-1]AGE52223.1 hypothetical protein PBCVCVR1_569R [Paramecium bursaria Chlorella virus CVR-1]
MDFRDISPRSLTWTRGGRNGNIVASRSSSTRPIVFQIPRMNATISTHSPGMYRMDVKLNMADNTHRQFADWIADLEQSAVGTWSSTLKKSKLLYNDGFRVMFFADTNVFDSTGALSVDFFKAKSVSSLCILQGLWTTPDKYGIRFNVKQLKFFEDALEYPKEEEEPAVKGVPLFIDDDE